MNRLLSILITIGLFLILATFMFYLVTDLMKGISFNLVTLKEMLEVIGYEY